MNAREIQRYALDAEGNVLDVRNITDRSGPFLCPNCHDAMIPRLGKIKAWHFAHKAQHCSYDAYLHSLAEMRIAEWFNRSESVFLDMEARGVCDDHRDCAFHDRRECSRPARMRHDLKRYYPRCGIERAHGGFVADILCPHGRVPLFIEILVTHECTEEKKASGQRIIELAIDSEESIDGIVSSDTLTESESVRLHGFKRTEIPCGRLERSLMKYTLYLSGKSYVSQRGVNCRNYRARKRSAIFELTTGEDIDPVSMHLAGKAMAHRDGCLPKDCSLCFWLGGTVGSRICKLYKKCGNPKWCEDNDASRCRMFREDRDLVDEGIEMVRSWDAYDVWRSGQPS